MQIDIIGGSYQQKYNNFNSQRTINWYLVPGTQSEKNKTSASLYPFPGLTTYVTLPGTHVRGLFTERTHQSTRCFAVSDNVLYEIVGYGTYINRGTMTNMNIGPSKVYMIANYNSELGIFHNSASYYFNLNTNTLYPIDASQFPGLVDTADYSDGYAILTSAGNTWFSNVGSMNGWLGTNTFSPTFKPAPVINAVCLKETIYNFTSETIEIYVNDGVSPFSRQPRSSIYIGLVAKDSVSVINDGFFFLGRGGPRGEAQVYFFDATYNCMPISSFSVNWALNNTPNKARLTDAYSSVQYTPDGHVFYYLTIPDLKTTYVYDVMSKEWTERQSLQPYQDSDGSEVYREFRGKHNTAYVGMQLWSDIYSTKIFKEDYSNFTEDSNVIKRQRISQVYSQEGMNISVSSLEIDCTTGYGVESGQGADPTMTLDWSTDGGYTYTQPCSITLGSQGQHYWRARQFGLGTGRNWVVRLTYTDPADLAIQSAIAHGTVGTF